MQSQHSCLPSEMTLVLVPTSRFPVSHLFLAFFFSPSLCLNPNPSSLFPSTSAYHLCSIFMSASLRKKQPLAVNWPISHISFPKVEAGRDDLEGEEPASPAHWCRIQSSLVSLGEFFSQKLFFFLPYCISL